MIDLSNRVGPGYATRRLDQIIGIAAHHTVSGGQFYGADNPDLTEEDEVNHVLMINIYHLSLLYGGIAYTVLIFGSGRRYDMGPLTQVRAGVAHKNYVIASFAFVGNFTDRLPTEAALASGRQTVAEWRAELGRDVPVKGHRDWAVEGWATACPGERWQEWIGRLEPEEDDMGMTAEDMVRVQAWVLQHSGVRTLLRGSAPTVYIVGPGGKGKRPFPGGAASFVAVDFRWEDVINVPDAVINAIPNAS